MTRSIMKDFIINFPEEFESKGSKWRVDVLGLCWKDKVPVFKDKNEYKACDANLSFDGDGIHAEIEDDDFDRIGQPEKLTCGINPIHTRHAGGHITVLNGEILELYYDDSMTILGEEEKINRLVQNGVGINRAVDIASKNPSVVFNSDTSITIFIYKHGDTIEQFGKKYVIDTEHVKLDNVTFAKNPRVFGQPERIPIKPYVKEGDIRVDIPAGILNGIDVSDIDFGGVIIKQHECDGKNIIDEFELREVYYNAQASYLWNNDNKHDTIQFAENLVVTANAAAMSAKDINETPQAKSPQDAIIETCDAIKALLLEKNRKYGNSALNPCRVFSKADSVEQLKVRIDDKINRIKNEQNDEDEDVVKDLIGYLVLLIIARGNGHAEEEI